MSKTGAVTAREILSDEEVLARRDRNAFDGGFQAGLQCVQETHAELLEALKELSYLEPLCDDGDPLLTSARDAAKAAIAKAEAK